MRKKKVRVKKKPIYIILTIVLLFILFTLFKGTNLYAEYKISKDLKKLNYSNKAITVIKEKDMTDYILENEIYSKTLDAALASNSFNKDCMNIYTSIKYDDSAVENINSLYSLGYKEDEIINIFKHLDKDEINVITKKEYIENLYEYILFEDFDINNLDRYITYKNKNNTSYERTISIVNIGADKEQYSEIKEVKEPDNLLVLVNKYNKLPANYVPKNLSKITTNCSDGTKELRKDANDAFSKLCADSKSMGLDLLVTSAYRDYQYQVNLYNYYIGIYGLADTDTRSARPGHSEHQTGLAVDLKTSKAVWDDFEKTNEYTWLKNNAHLYGFIIRYPKGKEDITKYKFEPWHIRYVGVETATKIHELDITYDEYYAKYIEKQEK